MSAVRTRVLLGDDTDLLAPARMDIVSRAELDVVMAGTTQEAVDVASGSPRPRVAILPAEGEIDGLDVCRKLKAAGADIAVILVLPPDSADKREACFIAGADDVVFAPVDAVDLAGRIASRTGIAFRGAPRAEVELAVHLQGSTNGPVIECRGTRISREGLQVELPGGVNTPPVGTLVRTVFTLYEGGTLTVWSRFAAPSGPQATMRFVGLAEPERRSIDYFVDFYLKGATARAAVEEVTGEHASPAAGSSPLEAAAGSSPLAEDEEIPTTTTAIPQKTNSGAPVADLKPNDESFHQVADANLESIASAGALIAAGKMETTPPTGFSASRFKTLLPRLTPAEISALRGTTLYNDVLGDLRLCSGAKLRLYELNAQLRSAPSGAIGKGVAEQTTMAAIAEAQQIHKRLEAAVEARLKSGNREAVRDLGGVNAGLVNACIELKKTLDTEILRKQAAPQATAAAAGPTRYDKAIKETVVEEPLPRAATGKSGRGRKMFLGLIVAGGLAAAVWQNRYLIVAKPSTIAMAPTFEWALGPIHVVQEISRDPVRIELVDATWLSATDGERAALVTEAAHRATGSSATSVEIWSITGGALASAPVPSGSPAPEPSATTSP